MVALNDLLRALSRNLEDERARERVLRLRMPFGRQTKVRTVSLEENAGFPEEERSVNRPDHEHSARTDD